MFGNHNYSLRQQVHQDLDDIAECLVLNSGGAADFARRVLHAIENTFNRIADQPKASPVIQPIQCVNCRLGRGSHVSECPRYLDIE